MDNRLRKNEICIVSLPSCGYVFASSPSCFIGYGFNRSTMEMQMLSTLLSERRIVVYEAGRNLAPGQQVFCQKICSKIIQSQFCIVLLNNDIVDGVEKPNANVYSEYGLMLGFNKYIIPFQHEDYQLAFNVAGLDTVKYNNRTFQDRAIEAIDQAILTTTRMEATPEVSPDVGAYLLLKGALVCVLDNPGDKALYQLGAVCGFNLCMDYAGNTYIYFGNFANLTPSVIAWRIRKLNEIIADRAGGLQHRVQTGVITEQQWKPFIQIFTTMKIWILVKDAEARTTLRELVSGCSITPDIFTIAEVASEVGQSAMY